MCPRRPPQDMDDPGKDLRRRSDNPGLREGETREDQQAWHTMHEIQQTGRRYTSGPLDDPNPSGDEGDSGS